MTPLAHTISQALVYTAKTKLARRDDGGFAGLHDLYFAGCSPRVRADCAKRSEIETTEGVHGGRRQERDFSAHRKAFSLHFRCCETAVASRGGEKTTFHILDTLAAILSGSRLRAGQLASKYVAELDGAGPATVIGTRLSVPADQAALANGMAGHGDETDDSHLEGRFHPGCAIVPAALAVAERVDASGTEFMQAVALGYDIGARVTLSLGFARPDTSRHSTHSLAPAVGAAAACAALYKFTPGQVRHTLSYAAQQASGIPFWQRDTHHVEKAFDFGGMAARNAVAGSSMVAAGFTAVEDPFAGQHNFFTAFGENPRPEALIEELGVRFEIMRASIKKWCVGSPIQSILDATTELVARHGIVASDVQKVTITMPDDRIHIVDNRSMPDVCAQHLCALALVDGTVTFESTHDEARMHDPRCWPCARRLISLRAPN